jgi:alcohol dehydrogenase
MPNTVTDPTSSALRSFEFQSRTRVVQGAGSVDGVGELARELGAKRALLVTDAGIVAAGHAARAQKSLAAVNLRVTVFDRAKQNPTTKSVDDCAAIAKARRPGS